MRINFRRDKNADSRPCAEKCWIVRAREVLDCSSQRSVGLFELENCWVVRARELVLLYKWVGWIRRGGVGEVDVCE